MALKKRVGSDYRQMVFQIDGSLCEKARRQQTRDWLNKYIPSAKVSYSAK
jgi:hypothetical protein